MEGYPIADPSPRPPRIRDVYVGAKMAQLSLVRKGGAFRNRIAVTARYTPLLLPQRMPSVHLDVHPHRPHPQQTPIAIVGSIGDMLRVECNENPLHHSSTVVALPNALSTIRQSAIADQEIQTAPRQIRPVDAAQS